MAERGEWSGTLGGSNSRTSVTPFPGVSKVKTPHQSPSSEGICGSKHILPIRKRKLPDPERQDNPLAEEISSPVYRDSLQSNVADPNSPLSKRRRVVSENSILKDQKSEERTSTVRQKKRLSNQGCNTPRRLTVGENTSNFSSESEPSKLRRTSRGTYHLGFYAESQQQYFAAFRSQTSKLKSRGQSPEEVDLLTVRPSHRRTSLPEGGSLHLRSAIVKRHSLSSQLNKRNLASKDRGSNKAKNIKLSKKKMTERKSSWNSTEGKEFYKVKELADETESIHITADSSPRCAKLRVSRRHTLPGRPDLDQSMGVNLSKCLSVKPNEADGSLNRVIDFSTEPKPSTSGLSTNGEYISNSASTVLNQIIRKLPRKKKSISEQDLSQVEPSHPSVNIDPKKAEKFPVSILKKPQEVKRRRSIYLDNQNKDSFVSNGNELTPTHSPLSNEKTPCSNVFKSTYPLRNRLKIADDFNSKLSPSTCGGGGGVSSISTTLLNNSLPATSSFTSTTTSFTAQSLSLPSSPSSPGMPFLDTFRRLRDSRRMSSEQSQNNAASSTKALKDVKLGSAWKRGHALRKSSMSSKLGSRGKSNSTGTNPCSRYNLAASDQLPLQMAIASGGTVLPMAPSIAPNVISSTAASGLLPPSVLSSHGAVGSAGTGATGITDPGGSSASTGSSGMSLGLMGIPGDSESEESEMGRLEALLASRGLPPSLFGALGPRMQHILHRSVSTSISSKAQQLLVGLQATGDEGEQLQAVIEMCQLLVMGNEDTLAGFPIKQVTPALIALLNMEHNFDMMNHACRALTYMMEALPRSSAVVVEAVPAFLEKLQAIQCMDVAEQSLTALNMLSRKHSKAILQARGVSACLTYIDFFSTNAQRAALSITANCFQNLTSEEFHFASDALPILSSRLTTQGDKKCVESVCLAFSRLVDCFQSDPVKLQEIASHGLLTNTQQLLVMSPPVLSSKTFIMVIRMLSLMCMHCPELAVTLLENNIAQTLCYLLTNSTELPSEQVELVARSPQELYEITCLIGELMPVLPSDGVFAVDSVIQLPHVSTQETVSWQWQDDRGQWHGYAASDSKIIELAHQSGEDEISVCVNGNAYTLDFHSMQQINDNTGTMRSIMRQILPAGVSGTPSNQNTCMDARDKCLKEDKVLAMTLIKSLFNLLYEVYSSSAGPAVRYKSLRALLRMVHFCSPDLLQQVLKNQLVSSHLATMLSSQDLKIIVSSLQMADLLMQKLPHVFSIYFRREGVMHQIKRLKESDALIPLGSASNLSTPRSSSDSPSAYDCSLLSSLTVADSTPQSSNAIPPLPPGLPLYNGEQAVGEGVGMEGASPSLSISDPSGAVNNGDGPKGNSPQLRFADVLKRKRSKGMARASSVGGWRRGNRQEDPVASPTFGEFIIKNAGFNAGRDTWRGIGGGRSKVTSGTSPNSSKGAASFLSNFNPVRWGRGSSTSTPPVHDPSLLSKEKCGNLSGFSPSPSSQMVTNATRDYVRNWIKDQAKRLTDQYFSSEAQGYNHPALSVMNRLIRAIQLLDSDPENAIGPLRDISFIMRDSDISPFEVIHSGLVRALLNYLTASEEDKAAPASSASSFILSSLAAGEGILGTVASAAYSSVCSELGAKAKPSETASTNKAAKLPRDVRLRNFLNVFLGCSIDPLSLDGFDMSMVPTFSSLVSKLNGCVNQLEQFPVKVHDLPGSLHGGSSRGGSTSAIKFFNTHQLKCSLQRHPECTRLKQWRGGPVKVDPLALVQAIERYLVIRGYGRLRDEDEDNSDDENSEEDIDDTLAAVSVSHNSTNHKLEFLIGDRLLPYNMTVYQAVRQFASSDNSNGDVEVEAEIPIAHSSIWLQTHTIYYRPVSEEPSKHQSGRKGKSTTKPSPKKKSEAGQSKWGITSAGNCVLDGQMSAQLPATVTVKDPSLEVLALLRVLNALNRHYSSLYPPTSFPTPSLSSSSPLPIPSAEFNNVKLTAKANRQLQDPLVIMTANLPQWLPQIAYACPFLFPFETRQLLFYAVSFDRDRALQRLMDSTPELNSSDSSERVTPRLERRKRTVSRDDILKQAETVIGDMASSRAMLEIQYENEVGTGLGPTLEFYALVSQDLLRADLELWRGETVSVEKEAEFSQKTVKYIADTSGVYPLPLARNMKSSLVTKVKNKFKFLGKFMAKAVMDSRMLDLNLHESVYKWILSEEKSLCLRDILSMDQSVGQTLLKLQKVVIQKKIIQDEGKKSNANGQQLQEGYDALTVDGCKVEDLCLNFTLPGYPNIELKKGGSDIDVTVNNIEQYLQLVIEWMLKDGVWRQMEALREGFESVFPTSQLRVFYPEEMEQLFCGASYTKSWDVQYLAECCRPDHGYTHESKSLKFLLQVLSEYTTTHQRSFLQFVTGSPRLPVGGFKSLSPPLTIVKKTFEAGENPDNFLPSVMTCVNYLKLPDYSSIDTMREKLQIAYLEGRHSFHLS